MTPRAKLPSLPQAVKRKIYKTGQTRGAAPTEIYQNRVGRNSTVLIPYSHWRECLDPAKFKYERGCIVLISPKDYFSDPDVVLEAGFEPGRGLLVFYTQRQDWLRWSPDSLGWSPACSRLTPQGGEYVARIPGTTASRSVAPIAEGFTTTAMRGAGIRVYEYASAEALRTTRLQLEALLWFCHDTTAVLEESGMAVGEIDLRKDAVLSAAAAADLLDLDRLRALRTIDDGNQTVCPLCLMPMSAREFSDRVKQAEGRERLDSTITEASLFHIRELRVGELGHHPYNLGWGHHHCNVVAKDAGIDQTLDWMKAVLERNERRGA